MKRALGERNNKAYNMDQRRVKMIQAGSWRMVRSRWLDGCRRVNIRKVMVMRRVRARLMRFNKRGRIGSTISYKGTTSRYCRIIFSLPYLYRTIVRKLETLRLDTKNS